MKSWVKIVGVGIALSGLLTGCAGYCTYYGTPCGLLYAKVSGPGMATESERGSKTGIATAQSILGLVAMGDCSITAAARNGNITKIKTVDYDITNYAVFAQVTTRVTGE